MQGIAGSTLGRRVATLFEAFYGVIQSLKANVGVASSITPLLLPKYPSSTLHSLRSLSPNTLLSEIMDWHMKVCFSVPPIIMSYPTNALSGDCFF